jgi:hypothetical protein
MRRLAAFRDHYFLSFVLAGFEASGTGARSQIAHQVVESFALCYGRWLLACLSTPRPPIAMGSRSIQNILRHVVCVDFDNLHECQSAFFQDADRTNIERIDQAPDPMKL